MESDAVHKYKIIDNEHIEFYIKNRKGKIFKILVDIDVFDEIKEYSWHTTWKKDAKSYYVSRTIYLGTENNRAKYETVFLHNHIMRQPKGKVVDHINHNTLDNRVSNLRIANKAQNCKHRKGKNSNNTSGYRNVSKVGNKWVVQLQVDGKNTCLGKFDDVHEAGKFAKEMRTKHYGEFAGRC